jgi:proliferating cell nuclear antigen
MDTDDMPPSAECMLEIRTVQSSAFRVLIECLKELLTDTAIELDDKGLKIVSMDTSRIALVHLRLDATRFEQFFCPKPMTIGINLLNLHKILKCVASADILTLRMESQNFIEIRVSNDKSKTNYKLNLLDLDSHKLSVEPATFSSFTTLVSTDFQKVLRDMAALGAQYVDIKKFRNQLILSAQGESCLQETTLTDTKNKDDEDYGDDESIVQGVFSIKHLTTFLRASPLSSQFELYLQNCFPLILSISVASLGQLRLCLGPQSPSAD